MAHPLVVAGKMLRATHEGQNQRWWRAFSEERADALLKPVACCAPGSSIHRGDAALAAGRPDPTTKSCTGSGDKGPGGNDHNFLELIGSVAVAVPADYTRYR